MKKLVHLKLNILSKVEKFNDQLNLFTYGLPDDDGNIDGAPLEDYLNNYRLLSPQKVEKLQGGICWDFCQYEDWYFKKHFPELKTKFFYIVIDNNADCPTHTFLTFRLNGRFYWFESSWQSNQGIHEYSSEEGLLNDVVAKLCKTAPGYPVFYREYNPEDMHAGMTISEYMDAMETDLIEYVV